jgi:hypothetical protein
MSLVTQAMSEYKYQTQQRSGETGCDRQVETRCKCIIQFDEAFNPASLLQQTPQLKANETINDANPTARNRCYILNDR